MDLGHVFEALMKPVCKHFKERWQKIKLSQEVACILLGGRLLDPHVAEHDARMLRDCFHAFTNLLA
jgi:hypothetical protein